MKKIIVGFFILFSIILHAQTPAAYFDFSTCGLPDKWTSSALSGPNQFQFGNNAEDYFNPNNCAVVYNQLDRSDATKRKFNISSNKIVLSTSDRYNLSFSLKFTNPTFSTFRVIVNNVTIYSVASTLSTYTYANIPFSISQAAKEASIVFEYESRGNDFGTQLILDDISVSINNDDCQHAIQLINGEACIKGNMRSTFSAIAPTSCTGSFQNTFWYSYQADFTGLLEINANSQYNAGVSVYEGDCNQQTEIKCIDKDEIGFYGENSIINVASGKNYLIRVSKKINYFGLENGNHCISVKKVDKSPTVPNNDICNTKIPVIVNANCVNQSNVNANWDGPAPNLNLKSRSDIWFSFTPANTKALDIISHADFAEVISLYKGNCASPTMIKVEDLGESLFLSNPVAGTEYLVQLSGYFATVEGNVCLEVKEHVDTPPANEDCISAVSIKLNESCQSSLFKDAKISKVKPECVVYNASDVWYKFIAPTEKSVAIQIKSGFIYSYGVYTDSCKFLSSISCGKSVDPCAGFIRVDNLIPGKLYWLQILADSKPIKAGEGDICIRIDELSKAQAYNPLDLKLTTECLHGVLGKLTYSAKGGTGQLTYTGPKDTELFLPGTKVDAFVEDENGCRDLESVEFNCAAPARCKNSNLDINLTTECVKDNLGRQTGEVILHYTGKGGSGAYYFYGNQEGSTLKHGDLYKIIIVDSDSCYVVEEGKIYCPPFDCSQSALKINVSYDCVDTLLKAILKVDITGQLGQIITYTGNKTDDLLDAFQYYSVEVTDEAGCKQLTSGMITCHFDSCVYARPSLSVTYDCIRDNNGGQTGEAKLNVLASSKAGGVHFIGNQPNDILHHKDKYSVQLVDQFGCGLKEEGEIYCVPLSISNQGNEIEVKVFPNPARENIQIEFQNGFNDNKAYVKLLNASGELIETKNKSLRAGINILDWSTKELNAGLYFISIETKTSIGLVKFVKI